MNRDGVSTAAAGRLNHPVKTLKATLKRLAAGPEKQINIFIHGYGSLGSNEEFDCLAGMILRARLPGRVYLLFWKSGSWNPSLHAHVLTCGFSCFYKFVEFKYFERKAEQLGRRLLLHLSKVPLARELPVNLIGYSLGARVVHYALAYSDWSKYRLRDVVLLAGAADAKDDDWPACAMKIRGKIFNAWSPVDRGLVMKPDLRAAIGRYGILWRHPKIINRRYLLAHCEYLENMEYIFSRLWSRFRPAKAMLVKETHCPYCRAELRVFAPWHGSSDTCPECGLDFEFDGHRLFRIENDIECAECGTSNMVLPDEKYDFCCHNKQCGALIWRSGLTFR